MRVETPDYPQVAVRVFSHLFCRLVSTCAVIVGRVGAVRGKDI